MRCGRLATPDCERANKQSVGAVAAKGPGHGMADPEWTYAGRPMSLIGG